MALNKEEINTNTTPSNDDYLTVSALNAYLKAKFDRDPYLMDVYLQGEISNFRLRSKTQYFSLKDDNAKISAIMFANAFSRLKFRPEEGMKVLVHGRVSLYPRYGEYSIYINSMTPAGLGSLYLAYEQLKKKLAAEGLFSRPKKPLSRFPKRIAVVTSPTGAVIRDIITTTRRRFPIAQIVLYPAQVQGEAAVDDVARQIRRVSENGSFDTLIVGRGGGSIEDLQAFNSEPVARQIAACPIPVISSVGHETDTTIADLVADARAATPTAAAEYAVPDLRDVLAEINDDRTRLANAVSAQIKLDSQRLNKLTNSYIFQQPERLYDGYVQRLDGLMERLTHSTQITVNHAQSALTTLQGRLRAASPLPNVHAGQQRVAQLKKRLTTAETNRIQNEHQRVNSEIKQLDALSPLKIMTRGYSYVSRNGHVVSGTKQLKKGDNVTLHFSDGSAQASINDVKENK